MRSTMFIKLLVLIVSFATIKSLEEDGMIRDDNSNLHYWLNSLAGRFRPPFLPPTKRQFCPPGYFYNPIAASCMPSLSILRQRAGY